MACYLDIFSPETYETFAASDRSVSGYRIRQLNAARKIHPGDKFLCYITKLGRWVDILEMASECYVDQDHPLFYCEQAIRKSYRKRSIVRAFKVEHTTSIYSGILRMADLLALQPNMDIKLHIVAPASRKDKVFQEIQRRVFSLLEKGPLAESCTFISHDSLDELAKLKHLHHLSDTVLVEYGEEAE